MALQFNPPDWIIKEYMARKSPAEEASAGIQEALNSYAQFQGLKQKGEIDKLGHYVKAFEAGGPDFAREVAGRIGLRNAPALPGLTSTMAGAGGTAGVMSDQKMPSPAPQQAYEPSPMEEQMQQSLPSENPTAFTRPLSGGMLEEMMQQSLPEAHPMGGSPFINHWNATMNQPQAAQATPQNPQMAPQGLPQQNPQVPQRQVGSIPGIENPERFLNMGAYGTKRLAAGEALGKYQSSMEMNQPVSDVQYAALQSGDQGMIREAYPTGIPRSLAGAALAAQSRNVRILTDPVTGQTSRVPVAGPMGPVDIPGRAGGLDLNNPENSVMRLRNTAPKMADAFEKYVNDAYPDNNPILKTSVEGTSAAAQVRALLNDPKPSQVGLQSLGFYFARMSGSNSQLSDAERTQFEQPLALIDRVVNKGYKLIAGDLSPTMRRDLSQLADRIAQKSRVQGEKIINAQKRRAQMTLGQLYTPGLDTVFPSMDSLSVQTEDISPKQGNQFGAPTQTPEIHDKALVWAQNNPNDPRAAAILKKAQAALRSQ